MRTSMFVKMTGKVFPLVILILVSVTLFAQKQVKQQEFFNQNAQSLVPEANYILEGVNTRFPAELSFRPGSEILASDFISWFKKTYKVSPDIDFRLTKSETDALGFVHKRCR